MFGAFQLSLGVDVADVFLLPIPNKCQSSQETHMGDGKEKEMSQLHTLKQLRHQHNTVECRNPNVQKRESTEIGTHASADFRQYFASKNRIKMFGFRTLKKIVHFGILG